MGQMLRSLLFGCACLLVAASVSAQDTAQNSVSDSRERIGENHTRLIGHVEVDLPPDSKLYADQVELFSGEDRAVMTGNVVIRQANNQISADRADFNTKTHLGTFYNASGFATLQPPRQQARPGLAVPTTTNQTPNTVYFFGEKVDKVGPKKYRITNGGFSTCVQPTPRWDLHAGTVILNIDHYTVLRDAILAVKGVPMLYLPVMYYPTKRDERATGILIPTYGSSTLRGQTIHNAFFWAIDRSQDATFLYDWFSKTGQGTGGEYRYNFGGGSDGNLRAYLLDEHETTYAQDDGTTSTVAAARNYEIRGNAEQIFPGHLRARANIDYFSNLATNQTINTNIYDTSRNRRTYGANVVGAWSNYSFNGTFDHSEYFSDAAGTSSSVVGSSPRLSFSRNERPLFGSPVYFAASGEFVTLVRQAKTDGVTTSDGGATRLDFAPQFRIPFTRWQFLTVNSTVGWRDTFYTRSYDPTNTSVILDQSLSRRYFTATAQIVGPVFNRIWDTPTNGYAEKFKHSIEPSLTVTRTSSIDNYDQIIKVEGTDYVIGGVTQLTYGLTNRFFAKRVIVPGQPAQSREIFDVEIRESYYTDQRASSVDQAYQSSFTGDAPNNFSPISLSVRAMPTNDINAQFTAEFDSKYKKLRTISAQGAYGWSQRVQVTAGWSKMALIPELSAFSDPTRLTQYVNATSNVHTRDNSIGTIYSFNYDVLNSTLQQQRLTAFYNAQCCGLAFEYQVYNYSVGAVVPSDHRFFLSFTLAGLGNFSPFNGALSGAPR